MLPGASQCPWGSQALALHQLCSEAYTSKTQGLWAQLHRAHFKSKVSICRNMAMEPLTDRSPLQMLQFQLIVVHLALVITLLQWQSSSMLLAEAAPESLESSNALGVGAHPTTSEEKSATDLSAKLFLLDELVSLENEVTETKKKRSFPGFGSPIDRISSSSMDTKGKQRKVVELPKRRFGIPLDRIGVSHLSNTKG
ncbi:osteocrin isoform X2 [Apteryx mantelli]|nr:PREDICTED: osteocrin isoform X2 [Apteryx mantelli mantelli]